MNTNEVLIDLLEDNRRRLKRVLESINEACFRYKPDPGANDIAITIWHMGRLLDHFFHSQGLGEPIENQCWFRESWAKQTAYDPTGLGRDGWGTLNGYTKEELASMPEFCRNDLIGYIDDVYDAVKSYLQTTPEERLFQQGMGFDRKFSRYQCIQMALMDNIRHLGEIYALKSSWEREQSRLNQITDIVQ